jgi:hypothetical protein
LTFNAALEVLEDWDFWLQLTQNKPLVHNPQITAVYRQALGKSELGNAEGQNHWQTWHHQILQKFVSQATPQQTTDLLSWHAVSLDAQVAQSAQNELALKQQIAQLQAQASLDQQHIAQEIATRLALQKELEAFSQQTQEVLAKKEAELQNHSAELLNLLSEKERQLQAYSLEVQKGLDTKELEKQSLALQMQAIINHKENQLQAFAADMQKTLDAKALENREIAASLIAAVSGSIMNADNLLSEPESIQPNIAPPSALSQHLADPHLAKLQQLIELQNQRTETLQAALQQAQSAMAAQSREIELLRKSLNLVYSSKSWRWTAPLRASRNV